MTTRIEHRVVDGIERKWCNKCRQWLPLVSFSKTSSGWDGWYYCCRECHRVVSGRTGFRCYQHRFVDGVEQKRCSRCEQWLALDRFPKRSKGGDTGGLYTMCGSCRASYVREWSREHPRQVVANRNLRRAREADAGGKYTGAEFRALCEFYDNQCLNTSADYHEGPLVPDHVVALSRGGSNDTGNIQPLCLHCNGIKGTKTIDYRVGFEAT